MYTLSEMRNIIRLTLDLDETDLPDSLVDEWVRDGADRCQSHRQTWPFYEDTFTFSTVADQATYTLAAIAAADGEGDTIAEIRQLSGQNDDLKWQDVSDRDRLVPLSSSSTGTPTHWSQWANGDVVLYPTPATVIEHQVRAYKEPSDWVADGAAATSDMPKPFDSAIINWAIGRAYAQQDDPASAVYYADLSNLRLEELTRRYNDPSPAVDVIMNGGQRGHYIDQLYT